MTIKTRPKKIVDWAKVDELLMAGCLGTEIAAHFDMHHDTFYRKVEEQYGIGFTAYSAEKKAQGDSLLRAAQYAKALGLSDKGDNTLLIWLGKTRLGQISEENKSNGNAPITIKVTGDGLGSGINISTTPISNEPDKGTQ